MTYTVTNSLTHTSIHTDVGTHIHTGRHTLVPQPNLQSSMRRSQPFVCCAISVCGAETLQAVRTLVALFARPGRARPGAANERCGCGCERETEIEGQTERQRDREHRETEREVVDIVDSDTHTFARIRE